MLPEAYTVNMREFGSPRINFNKLEISSHLATAHTALTAAFWKLLPIA
jgi:hypothetical protein